MTKWQCTRCGRTIHEGEGLYCELGPCPMGEVPEEPAPPRLFDFVVAALGVVAISIIVYVVIITSLG